MAHLRNTDEKDDDKLKILMSVDWNRAIHAEAIKKRVRRALKGGRWLGWLGWRCRDADGSFPKTVTCCLLAATVSPIIFICCSTLAGLL
jgi:hypothetical protein